MMRGRPHPVTSPTCRQVVVPKNRARTGHSAPSNRRWRLDRRRNGVADVTEGLEPVQGLPSTWGGVVTGRLSPSQGLRWAFETVESARRCGEALREMLPGFLAAYQELLDRETFLDKLRTKADLPGVCPNEAAVAILLVDSGPRDEFEQAVAEIEKWTPDSVFLPWIRRWQQRTTTPDPGR
jgi:hypothetical protein